MSDRGKGRSYGGKTPQERRDERRAALMSAAREMWCDGGWPAVTMRGVCASAGLTDRYFYESFADRDALLVAVAEQERDAVLLLLLEAITPHAAESPYRQLQAVITAVVGRIADDAGTAQILFGDHGGNAALETFRRQAIQLTVDAFVDISRRFLLPDVREDEFRLNVLLGIGGFVETVMAWRAGMIDVDADDLVAMLQGAGEGLGRRFTQMDAGAP